MNVIIIEDEIYAVKRLTKLLLGLIPDVNIVTVIDEVDIAIKWFQENEHPDVIFMDIQLADGFSFEIFKHVKITSSVIFTTAFDQYALEAFQVNGIDYLLKPLDTEKLNNAIAKTQKIVQNTTIDYSKITTYLQKEKNKYKERFLVKNGKNISFVSINDISYFISESSYTFIFTKTGNKYIAENTLEEVMGKIDPSKFFQINRKIIVGLTSISKIHNYFNQRFKLNLSPETDADAIVSRNRSKKFMDWLDR